MFCIFIGAAFLGACKDAGAKGAPDRPRLERHSYGAGSNGDRGAGLLNVIDPPRRTRKTALV
jgi:hypothetical protein